MRGAVLASIVLAFALAGCMDGPSDGDWDAYDSGRGLAFGTILTILLVAGVAILIANMSSSRTQQQPPAPPPPALAGWEPVEPSRPAAPPTTTRKSAASKPAKPRRPSP